jgi:hypothetical protein
MRVSSRFNKINKSVFALTADYAHVADEQKRKRNIFLRKLKKMYLC